MSMVKPWRRSNPSGLKQNTCVRVWLLMWSGKVTFSRRHVSPSVSIGAISSQTNPGQVNRNGAFR